MAFPPRFLEELRDRVAVSEIVGRRVKLVRKGREFMGLCPFHNERTPSFSVNDEKGFYHCFGCGAHGDAVGFVMETEGLPFPDAVEKLAAMAGLQVPAESPEEAGRRRREADLHAVIEAAAGWYEQQLRSSEGRAALDYLRGRGLDEATVRGFRLGYAPQARGALAAALGRDGIAPERLVEAGLLKRAEEDGRIVDYFRGRVMFPIADRRGRIVAFGGRILGDGQPKYLNSPDHPLFHKGRMLFGLDRAREPARKAGTAVVVEGYMDAIALAQAGLAHAVAPLGTALTEEQIEALWRLAPEPVLCFDGDAAGQRAAARAAERALPLLRAGHSLRFATLPPGEDPDTLVRAQGMAAMTAVLDAAVPLVDVVWRLALAAGPADTPERRAGLARRLGDVVGTIADPVVRNLYRNEFRARFREMVGPAAPAGREFRPGRAPIRAPAARPSAPVPLRRRGEQGILAAFLNHPALALEFDEALAAMDLPAGPLDRVRCEILNVAAASLDLDAAALAAHLGEVGLNDAATSILRPGVYQLVPFARPGVPVEEVRAGLARWARDQERRRADGEVRERARQVSPDFEATVDDYIAVVRASVMSGPRGHDREE